MQVVHRSRLISNFFSLGAVQAASSLIQLLVVPYTIRVVGVDGFGVIAVAQVLVLLLSAFTDYGFNQTAVRDISLNRADRTILSRILFRVLYSKLILCIVALVLELILITLVPMFSEHAFLYAMAFLFVPGQALLVTWFFQGIERMQIAAMLTLLARVIFAILVFSFIKQKEDAGLFLLFLGIGSLVAGVIGLCIAAKYVGAGRVTVSFKDIRDELSAGWPLMLASLSGYVSQYANIIILRAFTNDLTAGYYGIAERLFFTTKQVLVVFSQSVFPQVCRVVQTTRDQATRFWRQVYLPFFIAVSVGAMLLFLFSPQVLKFFVGPAHQHSVFFLRVFSAVILIVCLNIPATLMLLAADQKRKYSIVITGALLLNIVLNILLVNAWQATGTVIAVLITELVIMIGLNLQLSRVLRLPAMLKPA